MKTNFIAAIALGLLMGTASANDQDANFKVNIPFDFVANQTSMPRGEYAVKAIGSSQSGALSLRSADKSAGVMLMSHSCSTKQMPEKPKLVFHRYGDRYYLSQVWAGNDSVGRELPKSRRELEVANSEPGVSVSLVASR
jgi:hypothetical protein